MPLSAAMSTDSLPKQSDFLPSENRSKKRKILWIVLAALAVATGATVVTGIVVSRHTTNLSTSSSDPPASVGTSPNPSSSRGPAASRHSTTATSPSSPSSATSGVPRATSTSSVSSCSTEDDIPTHDRGTFLDPTSWLDLTDFNCTYTAETIGDLPVVGLNSTWDDNTQANPTAPPLNKPWPVSTPVRGVNLGGWLSLEPFITPSLFANGSVNYVDEWTLCTHLGPAQAAIRLEQHYASFITEADFARMAAAGLDHVRIPFSYWAVETYPQDPYVFRTSWRYLLRGIEWARRHGLRVKLDLHALPGSQNGWNHSGRQGTVDFIIGPNGPLNAQRTLELHDRLSRFFAQARYASVVHFYGLANEPTSAIPQQALAQWTASAYKTVRANGVQAVQVFSDSMLSLASWHGQLTGYGETLVVDAHQYAIFSSGLLELTHAAKVSFACDAWTGQSTSSMNTATGFGPTMVGEWSQADTDCTLFLNGVGNGARWDGSFSGSGPSCAPNSGTCSCTMANNDPSAMSPAYKAFLLAYAEAQMAAYEPTLGWFYWTWKTESAPLWSYVAGLDGGYMPSLAYQRQFDCGQPRPSFPGLPETY